MARERDNDYESKSAMKSEEETKIKDDLIWAATKLVSIRTNFGNAPFTTDDLDRLYNILGKDGFIAASEVLSKGRGVWS